MGDGVSEVFIDYCFIDFECFKNLCIVIRLQC